MREIKSTPGVPGRHRVALGVHDEPGPDAAPLLLAIGTLDLDLADVPGPGGAAVLLGPDREFQVVPARLPGLQLGLLGLLGLALQAPVRLPEEVLAVLLLGLVIVVRVLDQVVPGDLGGNPGVVGVLHLFRGPGLDSGRTELRDRDVILGPTRESVLTQLAAGRESVLGLGLNLLRLLDLAATHDLSGHGDHGLNHGHQALVEFRVLVLQGFEFLLLGLEDLQGLEDLGFHGIPLGLRLVLGLSLGLLFGVDAALFIGQGTQGLMEVLGRPGLRGTGVLGLLFGLEAAAGRRAVRRFFAGFGLLEVLLPGPGLGRHELLSGVDLQGPVGTGLVALALRQVFVTEPWRVGVDQGLTFHAVNRYGLADMALVTEVLVEGLQEDL